MEKICIRNEEKELRTYINIPPSATHLLIICHGFRGSKENGGRVFDFTSRLGYAGFGVLAFDFSGSGESSGDFADVTLSRQAEDLKLVLNYVKENISLPAVLLGRSFGGTTVLAGGTGEDIVKGFILWSTPVFLHSTFSQIMPKEYKKLKAGVRVKLRDEGGSFELNPYLVEDFDSHNIAEYIGNIGDRPVLIIHGGKDEIVSVKNAYYMAEKIPLCTLKIFPNADHKFIYCYREREDYTIEWLKKKFEALWE
ncbi:alpha/beta fold hydrolase [Thermosyntropha sp.]|uniref:alpha/beta hydrolase family protein n=1 Tax=Thermosyntropha sp. TaxID=2740820 RepID=UPI0025CBC4A3|nr:alpha/beta fold hydrolase [Thermosyntropha sp.]MBO8158338.1 alpha/beta fold hydrolase [Thermosyntropha sp.]